MVDIELCLEVALIDGPEALDEIFEDWRLDAEFSEADPLFRKNQITIIWFSLVA